MGRVTPLLSERERDDGSKEERGREYEKVKGLQEWPDGVLVS